MAELPTATGCIGREVEVHRLTELVGQAAAGRGVAVLVEGEPGIGKTLLLDVVMARCAGLGMRVLRGRAEALERRLPFATLHGCLSSAMPEEAQDGEAQDGDAEQDAAVLRDLAALGRGTAAAEHEFAVTEAILDLIDRWCARGPVALVIDDARWIDPASAVVLNRLGRDLAQQPLALVLATGCAGRNDAAADLFRNLVARGAQPLPLGPLPEPAVAALVADRLGAPAGPALVELVARASGNPMYVGELLAALARECAVQIVDGVAEVVCGTGWAVPRSLVEAIQQRLAFLPRMVRRTLELAAVLGSTLDISELSTILSAPVAVLSAVVDEAMAAGLLVDTGGLLTFRHELIREALAQHQPAAVRAALHLRAGRVLAAADAPVERVAQHLVAGSLLDRETVDWLVDAAEALTVRAPALAVPLLRRALSTARGPAAKPLRYHLARALLWAGLVDEAEQAAQAALLADPDRTHYGALHWLIAQARYRQGRVWDANATVEAALASAHLSPTEVGRFHGVAALGLLMLERFDAAETAARNAIRVGTATGDHVAIGYGYHILAARHAVQGRLRTALADVDRAILALEAGGSPELDVDPHGLRGECLLGLDRLAEADDALATAVRNNQRAGGVHLTVDYAVRARLRFLDGRWDDALAEIRTGLEVPDPHHFAVALPAIRALIGIHRGGPAATAAEDPGTDVGGRVFGHVPVWVRALSEEARGDPSQALHLLYPVWEGPIGLSSRRLFPDLCLDVARLAGLVGDRDRATRLAVSTAELAAREPSSSMTGTALVCRGLAEGDPDALLAAASGFREARRPLYEGHAYEEAALLLARQGCPGAARDALDRALALYGGLDAAWDIARASGRLRQAGVGRAGRRTTKRPTHGWAALTDTEGKIALLVAEGLSNPEIATQLYLSRRTVQTHVSHILAKLGLRSRVELAVQTVSRPGRLA